MRKIVYIKTSRTNAGYAKAEISRFPNYSVNKWQYSFKFYSTYKFFDTYSELKEFVDSNYQLFDTLDQKNYKMPEKRDEFFK